MARSRPQMTSVDYVVIALSPALIMVLVGSLCFFLLEVFYRGQYEARLTWIMFWFVFATVLIARISMEEGAERASMYGLTLAGAVGMAMMRFVNSPFIAWGLMALVWWCAHKLTWDCTLIDDEQDASGEGLLQVAGLDHTQQENGSPSPGQAAIQGDAGDADGKQRERTESKSWLARWFEDAEQRRRRPHAPGVWVVYFSLAALPLFGLGQAFVPAGDLGRRRYVFWLLLAYVASGMGLLLTTSFLGLRRYLRQRKLEMPLAMTGAWLSVGAMLILALLLAALLIPRPSPEYPVEEMIAGALGSPTRNASQYAVLSDSASQGQGQAGGQPPPEPSAPPRQQGGQQQAQPDDSQRAPSQGGPSQGSPAGQSSPSQSQSDQQQAQNQSSQSGRAENQQGSNEQNGGKSSQQSSQNQSGSNSSRQSSRQQQGDQGRSNQGQDQAAQGRQGQGQQRSGSQQSQNSQRQNSQGQQGGSQQAQGQQQSQGASRPAEQQAKNSQGSSSQSPAKQSQQPASSTSAASSNSQNPPANSGQQNQPSNAQQEAGQPQAAHDNAQQPQSRSLPKLPSLSSIPLASWIRWLVYLAMIVAGIVAFLMYREQVLTFLRQLWAELMAILNSLFGRKSAASAAVADAPAKPPPRPFAAFRDPFASGDAARSSPDQLVRYTFDALQAWAFEHDAGRRPDETPLEFAQHLSAQAPQLGGEARELAQLYSQLAYARGALSADCLPLLRRTWQQLRAGSRPAVSASS